MDFSKHLKTLKQAIIVEEKEQEHRYSSLNKSGIKELKRDGVALHPIRITRQTYGYLDYPEIGFRIPFPQETSQFKAGMQIVCFAENQETIKGVLLDFDGIHGEFRIYVSDLPDWMHDEAFGLRLMPDTRTLEVMQNSIALIENEAKFRDRITNLIQENESFDNNSDPDLNKFEYQNKQLNQSQKTAIVKAYEAENNWIIHGPPGTGKTTTIVELIGQYVKENVRVLVSAPSNNAVDNLAKKLIAQRIKIFRLGNTSKVDEIVLPYTAEGLMKGNQYSKEIKNLKIKSVEMRKMATQYKRRFGKDERDQRKLLLAEVKKIQREIRDLQSYAEDKFYEEAQVILSTPIGLQQIKNEEEFEILIIDEAGQCMEPIAYTIIPKAKKTVLAGDPFQLPPTVLSHEAVQLGLNVSILERAINSNKNISLLDTQYRMPFGIAEFSNQYFYKGLLKSEKQTEGKITFIDTAGSDAKEKNEEGRSLQNDTEALLITKLIEEGNLEASNTIIISPYSGQVALIKEKVGNKFRVNTIDGFQGQESDNILISLVRSNENGDIGFLKDYRRMNVALTRAKVQLIVIGDSATIGQDKFYNQFLEFVEKDGIYRSIWEFEI